MPRFGLATAGAAVPTRSATTATTAIRIFRIIGGAPSRDRLTHARAVELPSHRASPEGGGVNIDVVRARIGNDREPQIAVDVAAAALVRVELHPDRPRRGRRPDVNMSHDDFIQICDVNRPADLFKSGIDPHGGGSATVRV